MTPDIISLRNSRNAYQSMDDYLREVMHKNNNTHCWGDLLVWFGTGYLEDYPKILSENARPAPVLFRFDPARVMVYNDDDWCEGGDFIAVDAIACTDELEFDTAKGTIEYRLYELLGRDDLKEERLT